MQRVTLTLTPTTEFAVPWSSGYQTYGALLSMIDEIDGDVAESIHDTPFGSLSNSGLLGDDWGSADRDYHNTVLPSEEYDMQLGVIHPEDDTVFDALMQQLVIEDNPIPLAHGELVLQAIPDKSNTNHSELLADAATIAETADGVRMQFVSPTCRQLHGDVWEQTPDRKQLFAHLAERWNNSSPDQSDEISISPETLGESLFPVIETESIDTHTMVVYRDDPDDGGDVTPNEVQGFTGTWNYRFKQATESVKTVVIALSLFAEYVGVGRHTARGGGSVEVEIIGGEKP